jgi:hypothetical protein
MKNKIAIASAFLAASSFSFAEIALTESLSVEGFIDTGYTDNNIDANGNAGNASFDLNEVEISFLFDAGAVSAQVDTEYTTAAGSGELDQAFISYDVFGGTLSAGLMDSQLFLQATEAPGLYTNSLAYGAPAQAPADEAVNFTVQLDEVSSLGVSFVNGTDGFLGDNSADNIIEVAYGRDLGNGFGVFVGARQTENSDNDVVNAYVTYETGALMVAAEVIDSDVLEAYQLLANYAYADNASVTVRFTNVEAGGLDNDIVTIAHQLALSDNLMLTTEYSDLGDLPAGEVFSIGALFTF